MTTTHMSPNPSVSPQLNNDEIDLRQIVGALGRQKILIGGTTLAAFLLSALYTLTLKPIWEGSFQIVLEDKSSGTGGRLAQLAAANPMLANLAGLSGVAGESSLETELKILESPSVLKPIYNFVKTRKGTGGEDVTEWAYTDWVKDNLSIELVKGTSVLNLTYQDTDKSLVLPVLQKITKTYQEYSNRDDSTSINNGLKFAREQSEILRAKAKSSNRKYDAFKFTYGISDDAVSVNLPQVDKLALPFPQSQANRGSEPLAELSAINKELTRRREFLTDTDPSVQRLQKERQAILKYINQTGGGLISIAGGGSKQLNREILLEYKDLQRTALRDNAALTAMESELLSLQIQKAQERPPWELISTPTVLDKPVAPNKKRMVALGSLAGLVLGSGAALVRDHRSGLVFSEDELKSLLPCELLERLPANAPQQWNKTAQLLTQGLLANAESVALIPIGDLAPAELEQLSQALRNALGHRQLMVSNDLLASRGCSAQLLVTATGAPQRQQLQQLSQQLALQGTPLAGWLLIDPGLEA